jgi:hypothetical protein
MGPDDDGSWPQIPGDYLPEGQGSLDTQQISSKF